MAKHYHPGSPAWAGIDPGVRSPCVAAEWFPRVGGDRPQALTALAESNEVPPRGRG